MKKFSALRAPIYQQLMEDVKIRGRCIRKWRFSKRKTAFAGDEWFFPAMYFWFKISHGESAWRYCIFSFWRWAMACSFSLSGYPDCWCCRILFWRCFGEVECLWRSMEASDDVTKTCQEQRQDTPSLSMFWSFAIAYTFSRLRLFLQTWTSSYSCEMETMAGSLRDKWFRRRSSGPKLETRSTGRIEVGKSRNQSSNECSALIIICLVFGSPFPSSSQIFLVQRWFVLQNLSGENFLVLELLGSKD